MQKENSFAYILMDEMKIKNGLAFSKSSHKLVGFCDLGSFNSELSEMAMFLSGKKSKSTPELASHMLVFMARPVFKPSLSFTGAMHPVLALLARNYISCGMGGHRSIRDQFPTSDGSYK